jgi:hypothetical protein
MSRDIIEKSTKRELRRLAGIAYERELSKYLEELAQKFILWKAKKIDGFELADLVHKFHQGPAQHLFSMYSGVAKESLVARAIAFEFLKESEVSSELIQSLTAKIEFYKREWKE